MGQGHCDTICCTKAAAWVEGPLAVSQQQPQPAAISNQLQQQQQQQQQQQRATPLTERQN